MNDLSHEWWSRGHACSRCGFEFEFDIDRRGQTLKECEDCKAGKVKPEIKRAIQATRLLVEREEHDQSIWTKLDQLTIKILGIHGQLRNKDLCSRDTEIWIGDRRKFAMKQLLEAERAIECIFVSSGVCKESKT